MTSEEGTLSDAVGQLKTTGEQSVSCSLITIDRNKILGFGAYGVVFEGTWNEKKVAVKRIQIATSESNKQEEEALQKLDHPNIVKLFHVQIDADFRFYALELCQASLNHLYLKENDPNKYRGPMPSKKEVLLQLATGLAHIHEKGLIHRDLKPGNVLICHQVDSTGDKVLMKWADFGLSKPVNKNGSCSMSELNRGTENWYAPEILTMKKEEEDNKYGKKDDKKDKKDKKEKKDKEKSEDKDGKKEKKEKKEKKDKKKDEENKTSEDVIDSDIGLTALTPRQRATIKSDVFTEGLIFGFYLLGGIHPYGSSFEIAQNILDEKPANLKEIKKGQPIIHDILMEMLKRNPDERISSSDVVTKITNINIE